MIASDQHVLSRRFKSGLSIILNRPGALNSLSEAMLDRIDSLLSEALADEACLFVLFYSSSHKGFCAGGDVKELARLGSINQFDKVDSFFHKEYGLDLRLHLFPKPVIVIADGITMGGGLGIAAGAGISIATQRTRMAMPETRIGFFPDVGSTGWMFARCPKGYPEYLGLTGYEMDGSECVRLGFATHFMQSEKIPALIEMLENVELTAGKDKQGMMRNLLVKISGFLDFNIPVHHDMDIWVEKYFAGKSDIRKILEPLSRCHEQEKQCSAVFASIAERSPTALVLTLKLLRHNEGRSIADVFATELKAAFFITREPDYIEGVRARLVDKDDKPRWLPDSIDKVNADKFIP
jgi:enoyl-CoA hydratase